MKSKKKAKAAVPAPVPDPVAPQKPSRLMAPLAAAVFVVAVLLFSFSLFKNISYPLIWNDESEGAMVGKRVLEFGYPKVHDGKNVVFMSLGPDIRDEKGHLVGYRESDDAYIYITWGNYYWAAIGAYLGRNSEDLYTKTALLRLPFTIAGFIGLLVFLIPFRRILPGWKPLAWFAALFFFIELFSVSLVLHMREARYFSLVILVCGVAYYIYVSYFITRKWSYIAYLIFGSALLFIAYNVNFISYGILATVFTLMILARFGRNCFSDRNNIRQHLLDTIKDGLPMAISLIAIVPLLIYFDTFNVSREISAYSNFTAETYKANLGAIVRYFTNLELLYTLLVVKAMWLIVKLTSANRRLRKGNTERPIIVALEKAGWFATVLFVVFGVLIARSPYLFVRHYIAIQPIMVLIILCDVFALFYYTKEKTISQSGAWAMAAIGVVVFAMNSANKLPYMQEHYYEMTHQYKGVLDYVIPYIKSNFKDPKNLVIATDYEEFSYMYYLDSKVTIGYIKNNLEDDLKHQPDIFMYRRSWGPGNAKLFEEFLKKADYERVSFPVADYPVNNIPELDFVFKHQFRTLLASTEEDKAAIYVRVKK